MMNIPPENKPFESVLELYYPIVDNLSCIAVLESNNTTATTVGMSAVPIYWSSFIRDTTAAGYAIWRLLHKLVVVRYEAASISRMLRMFNEQFLQQMERMMVLAKRNKV